jgi:hypothetical protein
MKHSSLLDAYKTAINIVPQLAWLGLSIDDRYYQLKQAEHVVRDAAAAAIGAGQHHTALEWLEQGRSVIWNQLFQLRTPLDDLKQVQPDLADKLIEVSKNLEAVGTSEVVASGSNQYSINSMAQRCHDLALKQEEIVRQIRAIQGFERFLLPKTLSELVSAAHAGPVVILNVSKIRCDALVITSKSDTVLHVPLSNLTYKDAQELHKSLRNLLFSYGRSILSEADRAGSSVPVIEDPEMEFQSILSTLWIDIVKPVLDALCYRVSTEL